MHSSRHFCQFRHLWTVTETKISLFPCKKELMQIKKVRESKEQSKNKQTNTKFRCARLISFTQAWSMMLDLSSGKHFFFLFFLINRATASCRLTDCVVENKLWNCSFPNKDCCSEKLALSVVVIVCANNQLTTRSPQWRRSRGLRSADSNGRRGAKKNRDKS